MSTGAALTRLAQSSSEAAVGILEMFAPGQVQAGDVAVLDAGSNPLAGLPYPAVATSVSYVDGVTGGNVFVMTLEGARKLAAAMMGAGEPEPSDAGELTELEASAVSEAMNQMMATAAGAISTVLGTDVEIGTPETRTFLAEYQTANAYPASPHMVRAAFSVCGEPCRLVQLVPNAFVVRMSRALGEQEGDLLAEPATGTGAIAGDIMRGVGLRVWAELGRAHLPVGRAVGLAAGSVLELDRAADDPVDLYVNGRPFASGRLMLADDGEWAVRIEHITPPSAIAVATEGEL